MSLRGLAWSLAGASAVWLGVAFMLNLCSLAWTWAAIVAVVCLSAGIALGLLDHYR